MLTWLQSNLPTILIVTGLALFFGFLVYTLIRDKRKGRSSCCGGCAGCAMAGQCHGRLQHTDTAPTTHDTAATGRDSEPPKP